MNASTRPNLDAISMRVESPYQGAVDPGRALARSREDVRALLFEVDRLREERAALRGVVRDLTFDGCVSETDDTGNSAECFWCGGVLIEADCPTHGPRAGCMGWTSAGHHHPNCAFVRAGLLLDDRTETT